MAPTETLAEQHAATLGTLPRVEPRSPSRCSRDRRGRGAPRDPRTALERRAGAGRRHPRPDRARCRLRAPRARRGRRAASLRRSPACRSRRQGPGGSRPHVLHMTATPIPRTLSLTAYGDLDATALRELPAGRQPVKTWAVGEERRPGAYEFIRERLREGRQAYVVCPWSRARQARGQGRVGGGRPACGAPSSATSRWP